MKTLLILTREPFMSAAIQSVLDPRRYRTVGKRDVQDADLLLARGVIDAVILDADLVDVRAIRVVEELKRTAPGCPVIIYADRKQWEWEEDAYLLGVEHVLMKPVRDKLLNALLDRLFEKLEKGRPPAAEKAGPVREQRVFQGFDDHVQALETLRRFSGVLSHCLDPDALLREVLLLIRELIDVNRAVIFLRNPGGPFGEGLPGWDDYSMRLGCAIGLEPEVLKHVALSLGEGIGACLRKQGRILKASSPEALASREITREFQILGVQIAIPILDREALIGIAMFDERLTGETYKNEELSLFFHMFEQVGLAIRNSWLHDQLVNNHRMIADILGTLPCGCVVINDNLDILHTNAVARRCLLPAGSDGAPLEFANLPQDLGSKVFIVLTKGTSFPPFQYQFPGSSGALHQATVTPFPVPGEQVSRAALLLIEDITERVRAQKAEMETSNLRLVASMAARLAHEIGNAITPISAHQQLLDEKIDDPVFRESLSTTMAEGVKRISRLAGQMVQLASDGEVSGNKIGVAGLLAEAWQAACAQIGDGAERQPRLAAPAGDWVVTGSQKGLRHAFFEIFLNAILANPSQPDISAEVAESANNGGTPGIRISIRDTGEGFSTETAAKASAPFFSTRAVGIGIGLTVARRIIENHGGAIEIETPSNGGRGGVLNVTLPGDRAPAKANGEN